MIDNSPETIISSIENKRIRRTKDEIKTLLEASLKILDAEDYRISVRHLYYRLFSLGMIENNKKSYNNLCHHLKVWRRKGKIDYNVFSDNTRWKLGPEVFDGIDDAFNDCIETYKRDMWSNQDDYIEIWTEKDTISGVLNRAASPLGINTFICKGNASYTALYDAAQLFNKKIDEGKNVFIYYLGDFDPCGCNMDKRIQTDLREEYNCEINFKRLAITEEQIDEYGLEKQELIKKVDYSKKWTGGVVELDALSSDILGTLVNDAIIPHIDQEEWDKLKVIEKDEKEIMRQIIQASRN